MTLVGRDAELATVRDAIARVLDAKGALLLVSGEAGIGKTTLADAFAAQAAEAGASVAWGRCWEAGGAPAYWPWREVFRSLAIESPFDTASRAAANEARDERFRMFEIAIERLRRTAAERAVVIVLDDMHAADVPSLLFLQLVARTLRAGARLGIVVTYREAEARLAGEPGALLAKIAREGEALTPSRLALADVTTWVKRARPDASADAIARVHAVTEGNPLFVEELLRVRTALDARDLPDGLRAVIDEHVQRVGEEVRSLLAVASVVGRDVATRDLVALSGTNADDVARLLVDARAAGLVRASASRSDDTESQGFAHILIRDRLYAELPPSRRAALHAAYGERLAERGDLVAAAHHLFEGPPESRARAAEVARDAARKALAVLAFEDAAKLVERASAIADPTSIVASELAILRAESLIRQGDGPAGKMAAIAAADAAERVGAPRMVAEAALVHGAEIATGNVDDAQVKLLRRARRGLSEQGTSDEALAARVAARLGSALVPPRTDEEWMEAQALATEALAMARRLGDPETLLYVVRFAGSARGYGVPTEQRYELVHETIELAEKLNRPVVLLDVLGFCAAMQRERGDRAACDATIERWAALVREFPLPHYQWRPPLVYSLHALLDGDYERAERNAAESRRLAIEAKSMPGMVAWTLQRVSTATVRGVEHIRSDTDAMLETVARIMPLKAMVGVIKCMIGRSEEGRATISEVPTPGSYDVARSQMLGDAAVALQDRAVAERVVDSLLAQYRASPVFWGPHGAALMGPLSRTAAQTAALVGRTDEAREAADAALETCERLGSPPLVERMRALRASFGASRPSATPRRAAPSATDTIAIEREGDVWRITSSSGGRATLDDRKGVHYLAELLRRPDKDVHVTELAGVEELRGDAGPVLDEKAKAAYKKRLEVMREAFEAARARGDENAAARAEQEIDALAAELAGAIGLGGRDRKMGSHVERARVNVQRRLKDAVKRIGEQDKGLGRYLESTVKTGIWCSFRPL